MTSSKAKGRTAKDFQRKDLIEHIRDIPDTYVGSIEPKETEEWIYCSKSNKFKVVKMTLPAAAKRVFLEILSNAGDNAYFSMRQGVKPGIIKLTISEDQKTITIRNGGLPMPVEPTEESLSVKDNLMLIPTEAFSIPLSSTNYDPEVDRLGCGRNGYGAKLTNIWSDSFKVKVGDNGRTDKEGNKISGQEYEGEWKDQMREQVKIEAVPGFSWDSPSKEWKRKIKGSYKGESYVEVEWTLAFKKMGMKKEKYTLNDIGLFMRYAIEFSLTCQVPVEINGKSYDYRSIRNFSKLIWNDDTVSKAVSAFCWNDPQFDIPEKFESVKTESSRENVVLKLEEQPESQILLIDTPNEGQAFSYVNGLITLEGGVHVEAVYDKLMPILKDFNSKIEKGQSTLSKKDLKTHVSLVIVNRIANPKYNSQSKTKLDSPKPNIYLDAKVLKTITSSKWKLSEALTCALGAKNFKSLTKTDGKKSLHVSLEKGEDANLAGGPRSSECTLYIVEGKSASSYPKKRIQMVKDGKDIFGYYPLQGKPMNVTSHSMGDISKNKEFENIKKMLGLRQGVNYSYASEYKNLRYGAVVITTDADTDGMHILGLILNLFFKFWPELLERGYIKQLVTPVVRAFPNGGSGGGKSSATKNAIRFYDEAAFNRWLNSPKGANFKGIVKYYKGLATSTDQDITDDMSTAPIVLCDFDDKAGGYLELAFEPSRTNDRKKWIAEWREYAPNAPIFEPKKLEEHRKISDIMNISFTPYTIDNLFRAIPSYKDGLKKSQRQALYYILHHWNYGTDSEKMKKVTKVEVLAMKAADFSKYHHGGKSLADTIIHMAQDFVGSNNLPAIEPISQAGTRDMGGKDAGAGRYVDVSCPWWAKYCFQREMTDLVPKREVDGELGEPNWIPCDIPLGIINGCCGVATGWSTFIPSHNPIDVINWILSVLDGDTDPEPLCPFYNKFEGKLHIEIGGSLSGGGPKKTDATTTTEDVGEKIDEEEDDQSVNRRFIGRKLVSFGNFFVEKEYKSDLDTMDIIVDEIPVKRWNHNYRKWVEKLVEEKKIKSFRDVGTVDRPNIKLIGINRSMVSHEKLGLIKCYPMSNMVLLDDDGIPLPYRSVESILTKYVDTMIEMYTVLKNHRLGCIKHKIDNLSMELKIILAYLAGKFKIKDVSDEELNTRLEDLSLSVEIFDKIGLRNLTKTRVDILKKKIENLEHDYEVLSKTAPGSLWKERLEAFKKELIKRKLFPKKVVPKEHETFKSGGFRSYRTLKTE